LCCSFQTGDVCTPAWLTMTESCLRSTVAAVQLQQWQELPASARSKDQTAVPVLQTPPRKHPPRLVPRSRVWQGPRARPARLTRPMKMVMNPWPKKKVGATWWPALRVWAQQYFGAYLLPSA